MEKKRRIKNGTESEARRNEEGDQKLNHSKGQGGLKKKKKSQTQQQQDVLTTHQNQTVVGKIRKVEHTTVTKALKFLALFSF